MIVDDRLIYPCTKDDWWTQKQERYLRFVQWYNRTFCGYEESWMIMMFLWCIFIGVVTGIGIAVAAGL